METKNFLINHFFNQNLMKLQVQNKRRFSSEFDAKVTMDFRDS